MIEKQQQIAELAETAPSCNYCVATIVARPLRTTVKGARPLRTTVKGGRGLGTGTFINLYNILASLSCPELNLINI